MAKFLPTFRVAVTVAGVRHEIEPSTLAMIEWERHFELPIWSLLTRASPAEQLLRLCWLQLKVDGSRQEGLPPFDDWLAQIDDVEGIVDDDDDGDDGDEAE